MRVSFHEASEECDCSLGEYLQQIRGMAERVSPDGMVERDRVALVGGLFNESTFLEDAREGNPYLPYGHRDIAEREGDEFLPDRQDGCFYEGSDEPGMNGAPGERIRFWMEFRGAPVDRRDRSRRLTPWHTWRVEGDFTVPPDGGGDKDDDGPDTHTTPEVPDQENVWGFQVTRAMCRCESAVREDIAWADEARSTYEKCDVPQHETGAQVETCFKQYQPGTKVVATTDPGGNISKAKAPTNPCERISHRGTFGVHELFHRRQGLRIASRLGKAFLKKYNELRGKEDQWEKLKESFPRETEEFMRQWNDGHDWAQSEIEAYKWQRRFYQDVLRALKRICASPPSTK